MTKAGHFLEPLLSADSGGRLLVEGSGRSVAESIERAFDSNTRQRGALGRDAMPERTAVVIAPSWAIHTFFMRFPVDLVFAARDGRVVKIRTGVEPWRMSAAAGAFAVVELAAGAAGRAGLRVGDRLVATL